MQIVYFDCKILEVELNYNGIAVQQNKYFRKYYRNKNESLSTWKKETLNGLNNIH